MAITVSLKNKKRVFSPVFDNRFCDTDCDLNRNNVVISKRNISLKQCNLYYIKYQWHLLKF